MKWKKRDPVREPDVFSDLLQQVADIRGIDNLQEFLYPSSTSLNSPFLLENIEKAAKTIIKHIDLGSKITVFCDFDNDGICSGVMMYRYLKHYTDNVDYLIFQRSSDHGLKRKIIPQTDLLIAVDSSTNDVEECLNLKQRGIEVVIIDHHPATVPNPHAIIVNNQVGNYPNRTLSGAGVVLKVLEVLDAELGTLNHLYFYDLAAVGIIGDIMSLNDPETRAIVYQGLETIYNEGLKQILKKKNADLRNLNTMTISFSLVPIINAATRMNQSEIVVKLLLCDDPEEAALMAKECIALNESRKVKQQIAVDNLVFDNTHNIIFCIENSLASNMRGLIATNLANDHQKPTIVVKLNEKSGVYEGSARGYNTVSFKEILEQSGLASAEGHDNAFGVQVHKDNVQALIEYCDKAIVETEQVLYYDIEVSADEVNEQFIGDIENFNRITGKDCEPLKVKVNNLSVAERKLMGKTGSAIKLVTDENVVAVKFGVTEKYAQDVDVFDKVNVIGQVQFNKWWHNGLKQWIIDRQVIIEDYTKQEA